MKYRHGLVAVCCFMMSVSLILLIIKSIGNANESSISPELTKEVSDADASEETATQQLITYRGAGRIVADPISSEAAVDESELTQINTPSTVQEDETDVSSDTTEVVIDTEASSTMEVTSEEVIETEVVVDDSLQHIYDCAYEVATYYGLDPDIMMKIMAVESNYNPYAVSATGDHGICQINERWYHKFLIWDDPYDDYVISSGYNLYDIMTNIIVSARQLITWREYAQSIGYSDYTYIEMYNKGYSGIYYSDYRSQVLNATIPSE